MLKHNLRGRYLGFVMSDAATVSRPRVWRLQFSLRLLLLALTAFAIGFPIWYRWPYVESGPSASMASERTITWQRQWGGGRLRHGPEITKSGGITSTVNYRRGKKHGLYTVRGPKVEL